MIDLSFPIKNMDSESFCFVKRNYTVFRYKEVTCSLDHMPKLQHCPSVMNAIHNPVKERKAI